MPYTPFTLTEFTKAFVPLFVAFNALGVVPLFISLTQDIEEDKKRRLARDATFAAGILAVIIALVGQALFRFLGITVNDFRTAGGLILLVLSINDLIFSNDRRRDAERLGIVPIGIPLIVGPAALTTVLILVDSYGQLLTFIVLGLNLLIAFTLFYYSSLVARLLGPSGSKAFAKVASLFLAAIAAAMIRVGLTNILHGL